MYEVEVRSRELKVTRPGDGQAVRLASEDGPVCGGTRAGGTSVPQAGTTSLLRLSSRSSSASSLCSNHLAAFQ